MSVDRSRATAVMTHEHCAFAWVLINRLRRVNVLFRWTTKTTSENVLEFLVESLVEKNVQAWIDGTIGVGQKVKTGFHVSDGKQSIIFLSEKIPQQVHDVSWKPTKSKRHHNDDEHAQYLPF